MMMKTRRNVLGSVLGGSAVLALGEMGLAAPAPKSPLCAACNGHGNCESDACVDGLCAPNRDVCDGQKRPLFACKGENHDKLRCCKESGKKCRKTL
jgi:hypothetical protein